MTGKDRLPPLTAEGPHNMPLSWHLHSADYRRRAYSPTADFVWKYVQYAAIAIARHAQA